MTYDDEYNAKVQASATREAARIQADATIEAARIASRDRYVQGYRDGFAAGRADALSASHVTDRSAE